MDPYGDQPADVANPDEPKLRGKRAITVYPDGSIKQHVIDADDELSVMQRAVEGYIQLVPVADGKLSCFCNEEGKLVGLEYNPLATRFVGDHLFEGDFVAGNFLIMGRVDQYGNTLGLTDSQSDEVMFKLHELRR